MSARYEDGTDGYRMPDSVGNVFRSRDRRDREYGQGRQDSPVTAIMTFSMT